MLIYLQDNIPKKYNLPKEKITTLMWLKQDMVDPECYHVDRPAAPKAVISTKTGQIWYLTKLHWPHVCTSHLLIKHMV